MTAALLLLALAQEPTPTPRPTPAPETRPDGYLEDRDPADRRPLVTATDAPADYHADRQRGIVPYEVGRRNYAFHQVIIPPGTLVIEGGNFTQALAGTVAFWRRRAAGVSLARGATAARAIPAGHAVTAADVGCKVRVAPAQGWARGVYAIEAQNGTSWLLDRPASAPGADEAAWVLLCPARDMSQVTLRGCNLRNVWLPTVLPPTVVDCQTAHADLEPEPTP